MSIVNPVCTFGCGVIPPDFSFDDCSPDVNHGQIDRIYIASDGAAAFIDWTLLPEWTARLDNTTLDIEKIRFLNVIGDKPVAEFDQKEISRKRKIILDKTHTIAFSIDETSAINYEALREIECGGNFKLWFQAGKYLYGGNDGIDAFITENDMIPRERKELNTFEGVATWENKFHPERCTNPLPTLD